MREPVRFQQSFDRVCRHVLNGIRVMPIVGLTCLWFCSVVSAQDARPAPSAATEDTRASAADTGGSGSRAPATEPPAATPAAAAPRTERRQTSLPARLSETPSTTSAQRGGPEAGSVRAASPAGDAGAPAPTGPQGGSGFLSGGTMVCSLMNSRRGAFSSIPTPS
jgi:hypothetical protein